MMAEQKITAVYAETLNKMADLSQKQKDVLTAALKLFAEQGFEATSTAQIAAEAGVASGSVYKIFPNKQELLKAVLAPFFQGALDTMAGEFFATVFDTAEVTLEDLIRKLVADRMRFLDENFDQLKLVLGQLITNAEFKKQLIDFFREQMMVEIIPTINVLKKRGEIDDLPTDIIFQIIFGLVIGHFGKRLVGINERPIEAEIEYVTAIVLKVLRP